MVSCALSLSQSKLSKVLQTRYDYGLWSVVVHPDRLQGVWCVFFLSVDAPDMLKIFSFALLLGDMISGVYVCVQDVILCLDICERSIWWILDHTFKTAPQIYLSSGLIMLCFIHSCLALCTVSIFLWCFVLWVARLYICCCISRSSMVWCEQGTVLGVGGNIVMYQFIMCVIWKFRLEDTERCSGRGYYFWAEMEGYSRCFWYLYFCTCIPWQLRLKYSSRSQCELQLLFLGCRCWDCSLALYAVVLAASESKGWCLWLLWVPAGF